MRIKILILGLIFLILVVCKPGDEDIKSPYSPELPTTDQLTINYFTANPTKVLYGDSTMLSWSVSNAVKVFIDCRIGEVSAIGSREVSPSGTTTYMLTAYGESETKSRSAILEVTPRASVIIDRTKLLLYDTTDPNNKEAGLGCAWMVWVKNVGNRDALNVRFYAKINEFESHACDRVPNVFIRVLSPGEVSGGIMIHWPFDLGCCEMVKGTRPFFGATWE